MTNYEPILINGMLFMAVVGIDYDQDSNSPSHKTEDGFDITDHLEVNPPRFSLQFYLDRSLQEHRALKHIVELEERISLTTPFGHYDNVVVDSIRMNDGASLTHIQASMEAHQIRVSSPKYAKFTLPVPVTTGEESTDPGIVTGPETKTVTDAPQPESILDKAIGRSVNAWVNGSDEAKETAESPYTDTDIVEVDF